MAGLVGEGVVVGVLCVMALWLVRQAREAVSGGFRTLAWAAAAVCAVSAVGALQRMGNVAVHAGWLPPSVDRFLWGTWEGAQIVAWLAVLAWVTRALARFWLPLGRAERVVRVLTGRLPHEVSIADAGLSPRERDVLALIAAGHLSDEEIAASLFIAPSTAATHVQRLLRKTGLHSRTQLMLAAEANGKRRREEGPAVDVRDLPPLTVRLRRAVAELRGHTSVAVEGDGDGPDRAGDRAP